MMNTKEQIRYNRAYYADPTKLIEFGEYFFPNAIREKSSSKHRELCNWYYSPYQYCYISFPRKRAKTTWGRIYIIHRIIYNEIFDPEGNLQYLDRYIAIKRHTEAKARAFIQWIMDQFEYNNRIIDHFGKMPDEKQWSSAKARFLNGIIMEAYGANQSTRGGLEGDWPYTLIFIDDPDDLEEVESPTIMEKHWAAINRDDVKAIDNVYGKVRLVGTVMNKDCCIQKAIDDSKELDSLWKGVIYKALENGKSIWEERFPTHKILEDKQRQIKRGRYSDWLAEEMNEVTDEESRVFKRQWFQYWDGYVRQSKEYDGVELVIEDLFVIRNGVKVVLEDDLPKIVRINCYLGIDPAGERSKGDSDFWVLFILAVDDKGFIYDIEYIRERMNTIKLLEYLFGTEDKIGLNEMYRFKGGKFESNAGFSALQSVFNDKMRETGQFISIQWVKNMENKTQRITDTLQPPWSSGSIFHKRDMTRLEEEAESHGNIHHEDVLDAKQMALSVAKIKPRVETEEKKSITRGKRKIYDWYENKRRKRSWTVI